jgi:hypothetical protein
LVVVKNHLLLPPFFVFSYTRKRFPFSSFPFQF